MTDLCILLYILILTCLLDDIICSQCYNYKKEQKIIYCDHGCCGDDYEEHCCDATLQIVGSVLGGILFISLCIGLTYYCYRKKSKISAIQTPGQHSGLLGRLGLRSSNPRTTVRPAPDSHQRANRRVPVPTGHSNRFLGPGQYSNQVPYPPTGGDSYMYPPPNAMPGMPVAPTAPMPPPYSVSIGAPPPYSFNKPVPPPPEYSEVVSNTRIQGDKNG